MLLPGRIIEPLRSWRLISVVWSGVMPRMISFHATLHGSRVSTVVSSCRRMMSPASITSLWLR